MQFVGLSRWLWRGVDDAGQSIGFWCGFVGYVYIRWRDGGSFEYWDGCGLR